ncbi:MAG TPA: universal stress protein [Bryobacteraceae bacterium]|nr:universal stress protein [Bryobacteraceae bacterium]
MRTELVAPRTILFPVDLSPHSRSAAGLVGTLAETFNSRIVVLHILGAITHPFDMLAQGMIETRSRAELAREKVADCIQEVLPKSRCEIRVEEGEPAAVIVRTAADSDADLICMPARGHGPFRKFLLGSTVAKVLNDAAVPLLTGVHLDQPDGVRTLDIRKVVCAYSPHARGEVALRAALLVSDVFGAKLTVAHALETHSREEIESLVKGTAGERAEVIMSTGDPAHVVSRIAEGADLVVIGRTAPGPLGRLRAQSYAIVRESPCPVLSV